MLNLFKKKKKINNIPKINDIKLTFDTYAFDKEPMVLNIPETIASIRLEKGAKDFGSAKGVKMFNSYKTKINNQWVNHIQGINSGYGSAHLTQFFYQNVNYYECAQLEQDPLFKKIFELLSTLPLSKKGTLDEGKEYNEEAKKYKLWENVQDCLKESYVSGGCVLLLDFGQTEYSEKINIKEMDMKSFKGFIKIDPIYCQPANVNTDNPAKSDFMEPESYYIVGLGVVHKSHFLKWSQNEPNALLKPLTMFFGMPLTLLIKQDVANTNIASQSIANLLGRMRSRYLKTDSTNFASGNAHNFKSRLEVMGRIDNDYSIIPIDKEEDISQLTMTVTGLPEVGRFFYQQLASKTGLTMSMLYAEGSSGLSGTLDGERANLFDQMRNVQFSITDNVKTMFGIVAGVESGKYQEFNEFTWNPLEEANERELGELSKRYIEVAKDAVEIGATPDSALEWLKQHKKLNFDLLEMQDLTQGLVDEDDELTYDENI